MKSATVTWIKYNNYGTQLQAFALQQYIMSLGVENTIISDDCILSELLKGYIERSKEFAQPQKSTDVNLNQNRMKTILKNYLLNPKSWFSLCKLSFISLRYRLNKIRRKRSAYVKSQDKFAEFKKDKLKLLYNTTLKDVSLLNEKFDVFLCGSDQIWSPLDCNFYGYYYLDFATKKKFSYATSIGTTNIKDNKIETIKNWTNEYYAVSVRESQSAEQLSEVLDRDVKWVLDPTLLLDKSFWNDQRKDYPVRKKFVVCYFLEDREWYLSYAKALSKYLGVGLYIIPSLQEYALSRYSFKRGIGPQEFIDVIAKAEFVLTDSYHASIFSVIFEKNFLYLKRFKDNNPQSQNIRIYSLFNLLNINDVIVEEKLFEKHDIVDLDYVRINQILDERRSFSQDYLKGCLL